MDHGLDANLDPGPPEERNIYEAMDAGKDVKKIPMNLGEALDALRADEVIKSALPGDMFRVFEHYKRDEWERFMATVTDWDVDEYLDILPVATTSFPNVTSITAKEKHTMCGIAGVIHRDGPADIGTEITRMLQSMKHRGPDSTGLRALRARRRQHRHPVCARRAERSRRLRHGRAPRDATGAKLKGVSPRWAQRSTRSRATRATPSGLPSSTGANSKPLADYLEDIPGCEVLSLGQQSRDRQGPWRCGDGRRAVQPRPHFWGTHGIGHVRMATESDVDLASAHPYWAYPFSDVAVVHNGQLTNYHQWRRRLEAVRPPVPVGV